MPSSPRQLCGPWLQPSQLISAAVSLSVLMSADQQIGTASHRSCSLVFGSNSCLQGTFPALLSAASCKCIVHPFSGSQRPNASCVSCVFLCCLMQVMTVFGRLPQNDVVLDHASISRQHAALCFQAKQPPHGLQAVVMDLGSAHGTFVQGARLAKVSSSSASS